MIIREEFDEEKEPDGMLLSGWTQAPSVEDANESNDNAGSTSIASPSEIEKDTEIETATGKKRKLPEVSKNGSPSNEVSKNGSPSSAEEIRNHEELQVLDDDDDLVIFEGGDFGTNKKKRQR